MLKRHTFRSDNLLRAAKDRACVRCGMMDGTVVAAHYNGIRQHALGKGMGHKPHDFMAAHLCHSCHAEMDQYRDNASPEAHSEEFMYLIAKTWEQLLADGVVVVVQDVLDGIGGDYSPV